MDVLAEEDAKKAVRNFSVPIVEAIISDFSYRSRARKSPVTKSPQFGHANTLIAAGLRPLSRLSGESLERIRATRVLPGSPGSREN